MQKVQETRFSLRSLADSDSDTSAILGQDPPESETGQNTYKRSVWRCCRSGVKIVSSLITLAVVIALIVFVVYVKTMLHASRLQNVLEVDEKDITDYTSNNKIQPRTKKTKPGLKGNKEAQDQSERYEKGTLVSHRVLDQNL